MTTVINISNGTVTALAGGPISLADLGPRATRRVSTIEFSSYENAWVVTDAVTHKTLFQHEDYDVALQWERDHFNERLLSGL